MAINHKAAKEFAKRWSGKAWSEDQFAGVFWIDLLKSVYDIECNDTNNVIFEHRTSNGGKIDLWLRNLSTMIEMKSSGVDLDKTEVRQGEPKTPFKQVYDYAISFPRNEQPDYLITCNFEKFRVYSRKENGDLNLEKNGLEFSIEDFGNKPEYLSFLVDPQNSRLYHEKEISEAAGELIGKLYDLLRKQYINPDSEESKHSLNVLCVRLVFCLFCEDAGLFGEMDAFYNYLKDVPTENIRNNLQRLFSALDTPMEDRDPYDKPIKKFPYVNGGLFSKVVEIPNFTDEIKQFLLNDLSKSVDWSKISPTIFGGIFESTLNPETRHERGMHYTSPENIHKVIDPLFLDDLKSEFSAIRDDESLSVIQKRNRFKKLHHKLCTLTFLDPAAGSGNFLTETYICLRQLEFAIFSEIKRGQNIAMFDSATEGEIQERVKLSQFYGIEINDFAVSVAETALWISRLKANAEGIIVYDLDEHNFPINEHATIKCENALRLDWASLIKPSELSYIMGNPPFVGQDGKADEQKEDMNLVWGDEYDGYLDYVTAWYKKAADYFVDKSDGSFAFVSTNSICQGQPVSALFRPLFNAGWRISYAWTTFVWKNNTANVANVHVVVVGMDKKCGSAKLFNKDGVREVMNINPYLADAPIFFIDKRSKPLSSELKPAIYGQKPADGGGLQLKNQEAYRQAVNDPIASRFVRRSLGAEELINGKKRWCLWLLDATENEMAQSEFLKERVSMCRNFRLASKKDLTKEAASTPHLFAEVRAIPRKYLCIPCHFSGEREYFTADYVEDGAIATNACFMMEDEDGLGFAILTSSAFMLWQNTVGGRLKSDCRFANTLVWNTFPVPNMNNELRKEVISCGKNVISARHYYSGLSLATLYEKEGFHNYRKLVEAHESLDRAVNKALGLDEEAEEGDISTRLVELYAEKSLSAN